jgi:hypothetical protein
MVGLGNKGKGDQFHRVCFGTLDYIFLNNRYGLFRKHSQI